MRSAALLMTLVVGLVPLARAADAPAHADPNLWLEGVTDDKALAWVREQNAVSVKELAGTPGFKKLEAEILAILDSDKKIPFVDKIGGHYYNFWRDKDHARGLWRRTTLAEFGASAARPTSRGRCWTPGSTRSWRRRLASSCGGSLPSGTEESLHSAGLLAALSVSLTLCVDGYPARPA